MVCFFQSAREDTAPSRRHRSPPIRNPQPRHSSSNQVSQSRFSTSKMPQSFQPPSKIPQPSASKIPQPTSSSPPKLPQSSLSPVSDSPKAFDAIPPRVSHTITPAPDELTAGDPPTSSQLPSVPGEFVQLCNWSSLHFESILFLQLNTSADTEKSDY